MADPGLTPDAELPQSVRDALKLVKDPNTSDDDRNALLDKLDQVSAKRGFKLGFSAEKPTRWPTSQSVEGQPPAPARFPDPAEAPPPKPDWQGPPLPDTMDPSGLGPRSRQLLPSSFEPVDYQGGHGLMSRLMPDYVYEPRREPGERGPAYEARADASWANEMAKADREGYAVKRHRDTNNLEYALAGGMTYLAPLAVGAQSGLALGAPNALLNAAASGTDNSDAVANVEAIANGSIEMPLLEELNFATDMFSSFSPQSLSSRLLAPIARNAVGTGKWSNRAMRAAGAAVGGGTEQAAREGIRAGGELLAGEEQSKSAEEVFDSIEDAGLMSGALEPLFRIAGKAGLNRVNSLRSAAHTGSRLGNIERAGGGTTVGNMSGLEPPPAVQEARDLQAMPKPSAAERVADPTVSERGMDAQDITTNRARRELHRELRDYATTDRAAIGTEREGFADSPEGQQLVSIEPVVQAALDRVQGGVGVDGLPLPGESLAADRKLLATLLTGQYVPDGGAMSLAEARRTGVLDPESPDRPIGEQEIDEAAAERVGRTPLLLNPQVRSATAGTQSARIVSRPRRAKYATPAQLIEQGHKVDIDRLVRAERARLEEKGDVQVTPRQLNARQLERVIRNYEDTIRRGNVRAENVEIESSLLPALYELRRSFGSNEIAPPETGGYHGMRERHRGRMQTRERRLVMAGLPRRVDEIDINDPQQQRAIEAVVRSHAQAGTFNENQLADWNTFLAERPGLERLLDIAAANRDLDSLEGKTGNPARLSYGQGGLSAYALGSQSALQALGHHLDPLMQFMAGVSRGGRKPPADAADYPEGRGRSVSRAARVGGAVSREHERRARKKAEERNR